MQSQSNTPRQRKVLGYLAYALAILAALQLFLVFLVLLGAFGRIPDARELKGIQNPLASEVYSADGVLMGTFAIQNRQYLEPGEIPESIRNALIATEDVRFYKHRGIDARSLIRVFFKTLLLGNERSGGGSTITQQLAKNLYPRSDKGALGMPVSKIKEMAMARRMEKVYGKDEILEMYLSTVPFGENTFGIKAASRRYFNREPRDLLIEEACMLVGMLKGTNLYNPVRNPGPARDRRNVVLSQMAKYGYLDDRAADSIKGTALQVDYHPLPHNAGIAPYFREFIRAEMDQWCQAHIQQNGMAYNLYTDGLKIHTTIDSRLQSYAEEAMQVHMAHLQQLFEKHWENRDLWEGLTEGQLLVNYGGPFRSGMASEEKRPMEVFSWDGSREYEFNTLDSIKHYLKFLQTGFLAMEVNTAEIRAWVGGINHEFFKYDHVLARRQPGSTFKPLVYLEALEQDISPCEYFANDSIVYEDFEGWVPRNADRTYGGYYSMKGALVHSVNTVSVELLMRVGIDSVVALAHRAGIKSELPELPSLALGTGNVSLLEMMQVYQAIANMGVARKPLYIASIEDRDGNILEQRRQGEDGVPICNPDNAGLLIEMLKGVVNDGTAAGLRMKYGLEGEIAGKTGTTQQYTDGWFIGFTPGLLAGVWVGGDLQNVRFRDIGHGQGAATALPLWAEFMQRVYEDDHWGRIRLDTFSLDISLKEQLNCDDYLDRKPIQFRPIQRLREQRILRRIFRRKHQ